MLEMFSRWLAPIREQIPQDITEEESAVLSDAILQEALTRFNGFLKGVQTYQAHPAVREVADDVEVICELGTTRLLDYAPALTGPVVFVIPSLVNRFDILDVDPDHSFLRYLVEQGLRPLVIDWDEIGEEEKNFTLSDYMTKRVFPMIEVAKEKAAGQSCHVLGYCMGGLLSLALALRYEKDLSSLTLMASPWDFAVEGVAGVPSHKTWGGELFAKQAAAWEPYLDQMGSMPPSFLQAIFTTYQPLQILQKYMGFASMDTETTRMRRFVLTEDWLNNGVSLAWPVAKECLHSWFIQNQTGENKWEVAGQKVDPSQLSLPTYLLVPKRDHIVPSANAMAIKEHLKNTTVHQPDMGHIGVMAGDRAAQEVWAPMVDWLKRHSA